MSRLNPRILLKRNWPLIIRHKRAYISMDSELFVGSYAKVYVKLQGLTMEDLDFVIPDGAKAGTISLCRDNQFDPSLPDAMLCVGYEPGNYALQIVERSTNILLDEHKFEVTTNWADRKNGPSITFTGINENLGYNPAWGGRTSHTPEFKYGASFWYQAHCPGIDRFRGCKISYRQPHLNRNQGSLDE